jgi:phosphomannomutase/phosphoglucomutase
MRAILTKFPYSIIRYLSSAGAVLYKLGIDFDMPIIKEDSMLPKPIQVASPNSYADETQPFVLPTGFREYDARWLLDKEINLMGIQALGMGIGTLLHELGAPPKIVTGHDYRSYSSRVKYALMTGLMASGLKVHDIGLGLSPMAYFAQYELDIASVAFVTASHNDNGWTGVKMGAHRPLTFGPNEMTRLKEIVLSGSFREQDGGAYHFHSDMAKRYLADLKERCLFQNKPLKVVVACGNGTAGAFAPQLFEAAGCDVVHLDTQLDYTFPRYNPNPEDMHMLHAIAEKVRMSKADVGLGFDGDGDRCGIVDNEGEEIFADKIGLLLARDLAPQYPGSTMVVDVKSTGLFATDPILATHGVTTDYWKTGHSYIKRRLAEKKALAGFEKSGHFFFNAPIGRGYDDGLLTAIMVCNMLARSAGSLADLRRGLPKTWGSPTMAAHCSDTEKYDVVERIVTYFKNLPPGTCFLDDLPIVDLVTVNGIRIILKDGTWGLVRASSNKPELVVVIESPHSEERMHQMFKALDAIIHKNPEVGTYNQGLSPLKELAS